MDRFINAVKDYVARMIAQLPMSRWGTVLSVDPTRPAVKVLLQPEGIVTGWLPVKLPAAGSGWTMLAPIQGGAMAFVEPDCGSHDDRVVTGFAHNDGALPPSAANANGTGGTPSTATAPWTPDEFLLVHPGGSVFRLCANGDIYVRPASGACNIDGGLNVNGSVTVAVNMSVTGTSLLTGNVTAGNNIVAVNNISDLNGVNGTIGALRTAYNGHQHPDPQGGDTGTTTLPVA